MHSHEHEPPAARAYGAVRFRLLMTVLLTSTVMLAEAVGGYLSGSLALMADAGHMLTDFLALIVAFAAISLAQRPADDRRTYGYRRLEILAALANGVALVVLSGSIVYESVQRWMTPRSVNVRLMAAIAVVGLVANLVGLSVLRDARGNLNIRGAFLHILGDTLSSVGVVVVAGLIALTGWDRFDALVSFAIAVIIVITSVSLLREVLDVLLEAAPRNIDTDKVRQSIAGVTGVSTVHDLHVWSIASGLPALSAHVVVTDPAHDSHTVREAILERLHHEYAIEHATLQMEREDDVGCACCAAGDKRGALGHAGFH